MVRVVEVKESSYVVTVPGTGYMNFEFEKNLFPSELVEDQRFYAHANLDAETAEELGLEQFEGI